MRNDKQCPLCAGQNHCSSDSKKLCWCMTENFPKGIFEKLSADQIRKACICQSCLENEQSH